MKRVVDNGRTGGRRALDGQGESEGIGKHGSQEVIVPPCFTSETKETKEDECAKDGRPSSDF